CLRAAVAEAAGVAAVASTQEAVVEVGVAAEVVAPRSTAAEAVRRVAAVEAAREVGTSPTEPSRSAAEVGSSRALWRRCSGALAAGRRAIGFGSGASACGGGRGA
ncbi:unnamed protein product, partial [Urochloa humidicola]